MGTIIFVLIQARADPFSPTRVLTSNSRGRGWDFGGGCGAIVGWHGGVPFLNAMAWCHGGPLLGAMVGSHAMKTCDVLDLGLDRSIELAHHC